MNNTNSIYCILNQSIMSKLNTKTIKIFKDYDMNALEIAVNQFFDEIEDKNPKIHASYNDNHVAILIEYFI